MRTFRKIQWAVSEKTGLPTDLLTYWQWWNHRTPFRLKAGFKNQSAEKIYHFADINYHFADENLQKLTLHWHFLGKTKNLHCQGWVCWSSSQIWVLWNFKLDKWPYFIFWFWMASLYKNIQLMLKFLKALFLALHFFYYTLMNFLLMLSVILLSMLMILLSTLSVIRHLICGNN